MLLSLVGQHPRKLSDFLVFHIVYFELVLWFVVAEKDLIVIEIYGFTSDIMPVYVVDRCLYSDIPKIDRSIPSSAQQ